MLPTYIYIRAYTYIDIYLQLALLEHAGSAAQSIHPRWRRQD